MPVSEQYKAPFYPGNYYHITFRSIDGLYFFHNPENHDFFLQQFGSFLLPVLNCLAYCLLRNHAHFVVQINSNNELKTSLHAIPDKMKTTAMKKFLSDAEGENLVDPMVDPMVERQVNSFMISYVNALNKSLSRKGSLFQSPFRRIQVTGETHLQQAIIYTNANAQRHGIVPDFKEHVHTSYHDVMSGFSRVVDMSKVLNLFGGREQFIKEHAIQIQQYYSGQR